MRGGDPDGGVSVLASSSNNQFDELVDGLSISVLGSSEDLVTVNIGDRHLGRRNQEEIDAVGMKKVILELRQLPRARGAIRIHSSSRSRVF